jgi:regulator of protease activity HflC (stomatin/prohibitin superfamily)
MVFVVCLLIAVLALWASRGSGLTSSSSRTLSLIGAVFALFAASRAFTVIPAGHVGVVDLFGWVAPEPLPPGIRLVNPLAQITAMSVMTQEIKETMDVPSKEGLTMQMEASLLFHLDPSKAADVYKTVGLEYQAILVEPQFRAVMRGVTALYEAKALYTSEREAVARLVAVDMEKQVGPRGVVVENTPLRRLTLPPRLAAAIEQKLESEQQSQQMQFVLEKERQEAERKRIEARGIADFQQIINQGLSEQLLKWKGIEATLKLAESQNAKVVVVGSGKDGLPLILGGQ